MSETEDDDNTPLVHWKRKANIQKQSSLAPKKAKITKATFSAKVQAIPSYVPKRLKTSATKENPKYPKSNGLHHLLLHLQVVTEHHQMHQSLLSAFDHPPHLIIIHFHQPSIWTSSKTNHKMKAPMAGEPRFPLAFTSANPQNICRKCEVIEEVFKEPVLRESTSTSTPEWVRYDYQHTSSEAYKALPIDVIVSLENPSWT